MQKFLYLSQYMEFCIFLLFTTLMIKFLLLLTLPALILSWWDVGHMLTSAIAQMRLNQLNPYAASNFRQITLAINNLCDNRTRTFIESAVWPDDLKYQQYSMDIWNQWHFIDTPYVTDATIPVVNYTQGAMSSVNLAIQARTALKANVKNLTAQRALFARYLIHLVGDIHQPLHSVALYNRTYPRGDIGGNMLKIKLPNGTLYNFHSFWDNGALRLQNDSYNFVRPMNLQNVTQLKKIAQNMVDTYGKQVQQLGKIIDPAIWAKQSFLIAQNTTYPHMMVDNSASDEYIRLVQTTSRKRITLAGYRLANFVIDVYTSNSTVSEQQKLNLKQVQKMFLNHAEENKGGLNKIVAGQTDNLQSQ